jgi:hypothetical protein
MAFTPANNLEAVEALYIGYFGRAGEPGGVQYWVDQMEAGRTFAQVAAAFSVQQEAKDTHPFLANPDLVSPEAFVTSLYENLLERAPDEDGFDYWVAQATAASDDPFAIGLLVAQFISGATNSDAGQDLDTLNNKIEVAKYFTSELAEAGIQGVDDDGQVLPAIDSAATSIVGEVDDTDASVTAGKAAVDDFVEDGGQGGVEGTTYTLTEASNVQTGGVDDIDGTANDDVFRAVIADSLDSTDILEGGGGNDVLRISALAIDAGAVPVISGIELIENANVGAFDMSEVTGVETVTSTGASADYDNASLAWTFTSELTAAGTINIDIEAATTGTNDTLKLGSDDNSGLTTFASTTDAASIEHITFDAQGGATGTADAINIDAFTGVTSLVVTGGGLVNIDGSATDIETVDASAMTGGGLTFDASGLPLDTADGVVALKGGAGADVFSIGVLEDVTATLGAGNDTFNFGGDAEALSVTGGAGNDSFVSSGALTNLDTVAELDTQIIRIEDFSGTEDALTLDVTGTEVVLTNPQQTAVTGATTLAGAVALVETAIGAAANWAAFTYGGSTYIYQNDADNTFNGGEGIIQLVGFTGDLNATNFVAA